eukprot:5054786-Amphidinium_carterae.1
MTEITQFRAEEEYYRLHEQLFEHQGRLQEQMIVNVQHQACPLSAVAPHLDNRYRKHKPISPNKRRR